MSRLQPTFARLRRDGRRALAIYITAGDPDLETSVAAAVAAAQAGADILEIGIPFSDPVADGPVIQRAMNRALAGGGGYEQSLELLRRVRAQTEVPLVVFGYVNPLLWEGIDSSCARVAQAGADGVLVVDVPVEEAAPFRAAAQQNGLDWVSLAAPTTGSERAQAIARCATGFLYLVAMTGVTGGELSDVSRLPPLVASMRQVTDIPICVGFGVRDQQSAAQAAAVADGVVVGSAVVAAIEEADTAGDAAARVGAFVAGLRAGVDVA